MTVINYAAGFVEIGAEDPIQAQMKEFLAADVVFDNELKSVRSFTQKSRINVQGTLATKTTSRNLVLKDGTSTQIEKVEKKVFHF